MSFLFYPGNAFAEERKIIINKKNNQLGFYQNDMLTKVFPIATGRQRSFTPEGNFQVVNKQVNPPYYKKNIPGGSPWNPLGPRWLGLSAPGGAYGIHGNSNPASIGTYASDGCIRLRNEDILWLFDQVTVGTPVSIVWQDVGFEQYLVDNTPVKVYFNNQELPPEFRTFSHQDKPFIPLKQLCSLMSYQINWNSQANSIDISTPAAQICFTPDSKTLLFNDQPIELADPPLIMDGISYVTQSTMETFFPVEVNWQAATRQLYLTTKPEMIEEIQKPQLVSSINPQFWQDADWLP